MTNSLISGTSTSSCPPPEMEVENGSGSELLTRVGVTLHGWLYRAAGGSYFRVLAIDTATLAWRQTVRQWTEFPSDSAKDGIIFPTRAWQTRSGFFVIRYELDGKAYPLTTLLNDSRNDAWTIFARRWMHKLSGKWATSVSRDELGKLLAAMRGLAPALKLIAAATLLESVHGWWQRLQAPLLLMPADVVFNAEGEPRLLAAPYLGWPDAEIVLAEPERIIYLAPELMGARGPAAWGIEQMRNVDRYTLAVLLLQGFYSLNVPHQREMMLARAANGTLFDVARRRGMVPYWLAKLPATKDAIRDVERLLDPDPCRRPPLHLGELGDQLAWHARRLSPAAAVEELRGSDQPYLALDLLHDVLLTDESYDHLVLAAQTAAVLERPLDALDFLGRATILEADRSEARRERIILLGRAREFTALAGALEQEGPRFDAMIWDDFRRLMPDDLEWCELPFARYLMFRKQIPEVLQFVYPRLLNDRGEPRWWKIGLHRIYGIALLKLAQQAVEERQTDAETRLAAAEGQLKVLQYGISRARAEGVMDDGDAHDDGDAIDDIAIECMRSRQSLREQNPGSPFPAPVESISSVPSESSRDSHELPWAIAGDVVSAAVAAAGPAAGVGGSSTAGTQRPKRTCCREA